LDGLRVFVFVLVALALWPIDDTALLLFTFFYDSSVWAETCMVMCSVHVKPLLFRSVLSSNHCILGERAWDIWTFMT
jgi:hypothetical protein